MAAGYAIPASVHDVDHVSISGRKHITQRFPMGAAPSKGMNGGPITLEDKPTPPPSQSDSHSHSHNSSPHNSRNQPEIENENLDVTSELPPPDLSSIRPKSSRPQSMQRRISVGLPTHLRLQGKGYGVPAARGPNLAPNVNFTARKWITFSEVLSSVLIALSFVFVSTLHDNLAVEISSINQPQVDERLKNSNDDLRVSNSISYVPMPTIFISLAVAAATLILGGISGKAQMSHALKDQPTTSLKNSSQQTSQSSRAVNLNAQKVIKKLLCVALPCYAASSLGAPRVTLIMLVAICSKIVTLDDGESTMADIRRWKQLFEYRRWTLLSILAQILFDFAIDADPSRRAEYASGYIALITSVVALPPPFPSIIRGSPTQGTNNQSMSSSIVLSSGFETSTIPEVSSLRKSTVSPLISSSEELSITLEAGVVSAILCVLLWFMSSLSAKILNLTTFSWFSIAACTTAACLLVAQPQSLQENRSLGLLIGAFTGTIITSLFKGDAWRTGIYQAVLISISFLSTQIDTPTILASVSKSSQRHSTHHHHSALSHGAHSPDHSWLTQFLLETFQHKALLHSILVEKDSRRIFYFMSLNFAFMLVQFCYGIATGSLGLLSDSVHMFFDCVALFVGLCAAVMSKWPPSPRFPYGYSKIDTIAGFANAIFLMLISIEIVYEAVERLVEGSEMQRIGELLTVSTLGLAVNLVGVTAFGHAHHGHSHHGHSHHDHAHHNQSHDEHSHHDHAHDHHSHHHDGHVEDSQSGESHDQHHLGCKHSAIHGPDQQHEHVARLLTSPNPSPYSSVPATPSKPVHAHGHAYEAAPHHHHGHDNENMQGIYLHVLADTLGSVAVVISTLLIHFYGWSGFDPVASCLIAILIFASAIPLVRSTAKKLLLTIPGDVEFDLREALAGVSAIKGVVGYAAPKFWLDGDEERKVIGVIHVTAAKGVDMEDLKNRVVDYLRSKNMNVVVQVEREGVNRCWCKAKAG